MPPSVGYFHSVKISAYPRFTPKSQRRGNKGEQRGKRGMWVGRRGSAYHTIKKLPNPSGSQTSVKRRGWGGGGDEGMSERVVLRVRSGEVRRAL